MDVELFLEGQAKWEMDSPFHLVMLHEMLQHASEQGQKEVEHMVCWGCQHKLPKLDPEADVSTVQLVGPQTSRKEIESLYYEVYKLQRLPGSPPRDPELMAEVVSSLEDHQEQEWRETPHTSGEPNSTDVWPPRSRTPQRRDTSRERSLTEVREAHHRALVIAAALEEEIEWLSCPLSRASQKDKTSHTAGTTTDIGLGDRRGGAARCGWRIAMPLTSNIHLLKGIQSLGEGQQPLKISIWRNHWSKGQRSSASSRGQLRVWRRRKWRHPPLNPQ